MCEPTDSMTEETGRQKPTSLENSGMKETVVSGKRVLFRESGGGGKVI